MRGCLEKENKVNSFNINEIWIKRLYIYLPVDCMEDEGNMSGQ